MSEELNKNIRDFFIKIGEDIKRAFDDLCPCNKCFNRARVQAQSTRDIENQVTEDMIRDDSKSQVVINIDDKTDDKTDDETDDKTDIEIEKYNLNEHVVVKRKKTTIYYDCKDYYCEASETKRVDSDESDDDFIIIY
jgi:hypothetical protein